jgi:hypothetical protein
MPARRRVAGGRSSENWGCGQIFSMREPSARRPCFFASLPCDDSVRIGTRTRGVERHCVAQWLLSGCLPAELAAALSGMASASSLPRILSGEALQEMDAHRLETDEGFLPNAPRARQRPSPLREGSSCASEVASDAGSGWASDRGSIFSERVEAVAAVAAEALVTPGMYMFVSGLACLLGPALVLLLAPLMVLLMPLLLPLGVTLLVLGLGRAAIGMYATQGSNPD